VIPGLACHRGLLVRKCKKRSWLSSLGLSMVLSSSF
jgi:hypothetical protein